MHTFSCTDTHTAETAQACTYSLTAVYPQTHNGDSSGVISGLRYYGPELGRWINRDPIGEFGGFNIYAFVENFSIGAIDNLGLASYYTGNWRVREFPKKVYSSLGDQIFGIVS